MNVQHDAKNIVEDEMSTAVLSFIDCLRDLGRRHNRTVVFMGAAPTDDGAGTCGGWLLDDTLFQDRTTRWLLLDDGNVWHETLYETAEESYPECTWVDWHSERLSEVLKLTLEDVRRGGRGGLAEGDGQDQFFVHDRRRRHGPRAEGDRRRRSD
jgi:hypothetical protein